MSEVKRFVEPTVFFVGATQARYEGRRGLFDYLKYTEQEDFLETISEAKGKGLSDADVLISFYAKLCYKSLVMGKNSNLTRIRDIEDNIKGIQKTAHGSVFEHVSLNFVVTDCSRVYTHEQVRHRLASYSQTSGRFCAIDPGTMTVITDPILDGCEDIERELIDSQERGIYRMQCRLGLRQPSPDYPNAPPEQWLEMREQELLASKHTDHPGQTPEADKAMWVPKEEGLNFDFKKKATSAMRRYAGNGQSNEMGMTLNIRTLRHTLLMRTARHAEREIRVIFGQVYDLVKESYPLLFSDAKERMVDGLVEVYGMRMNPYDKMIEDYSVEELVAEISRREEKHGLAAK